MVIDLNTLVICLESFIVPSLNCIVFNMLFTADVQCVFCGSKIKFFGSTVLYQSNVCASHNKEHQFPGINVLVDKSSNSQSCNSNLITCVNNMSSIRRYKRSARTIVTRAPVEPADKVQYKNTLAHRMADTSQVDPRIYVKPNSGNAVLGKNGKIFIFGICITRVFLKTKLLM